MSRLFCPNCTSLLRPDDRICRNCGWERTEEAMPRQPGEAAWTASLPGAALGRPIQAGGLVLFAWGGRNKGGVSALELHSGKTRWEYSLPNMVRGVSVAGNLAVFACQAGYNHPGMLAAVDLQSGEKAWHEISLSGSVFHAPLVYENRRVFLAACPGKLQCFSLPDGEEIEFGHTLDLKAAQTQKVWLCNCGGILVVLQKDGQIHLRNTHNLEPAWNETLSVQAEISGPPLVTNQQVYFGVSPGKLAVLEPRRAKLRILAGGFGKIASTPAWQDDHLWLSAQDHCLYEILPEDGSSVRHWQFARSPVMSACFGQNLAFCAVNDGQVHAISLRSGEEVWQYPFPGQPAFLSDPIFLDDRVVCASEHGDVAALDWHLGEHAWAAGELAANSQWLEAGEHATLAGLASTQIEKALPFLLQAEQAWENTGQAIWAVRLWEGLGDHSRAAQNYRRVAKQLSLKDPYQAARAYLAAAGLFLKLADETAYAECAGLAAQLAAMPVLKLEKYQDPVGNQGEWQNLIVSVTNPGRLPALQVRFWLAGAIRSQPTPQIARIDPGQTLLVQFEIQPTRLRDMLKVQAEFLSEGKLPGKFYAFLNIPLEAYEPPVRIKAKSTVMGKVRVVTPGNRRNMEIDLGNLVSSELEIVPESPGEQAGVQVQDDFRSQVEVPLFCTHCGTKVGVQDVFCQACGRKLQEE